MGDQEERGEGGKRREERREERRERREERGERREERREEGGERREERVEGEESRTREPGGDNSAFSGSTEFLNLIFINFNDPKFFLDLPAFFESTLHFPCPRGG
jgi:hypothetical protein